MRNYNVNVGKGGYLVSKKKSIQKKKSQVKKVVKVTKVQKKILLKKAAKPVVKNTKLLSKKASLPKKAAPEDKQVVDKEIKRIYDEREKLEMKQLLITLSGSQARQLIIDLGGENALEIVRNFEGHASDEDLAKKLKLKISDVRATLNKLHNQGLVNYMRDKDSETGWYSYSWRLNRARIENWVKMRIQESVDLIQGNKGDHYFCPSCGSSSITSFDNASDASFKCPKCEKSLEFLDADRISELLYGRKK